MTVSLGCSQRGKPLSCLYYKVRSCLRNSSVRNKEDVCERRDLSSANIGELPWKALFAASFNVFLSSHAVVRACRQHGPHQHTGRGREVTYLSQRHTPHRPKITTGHLISCCQHHVLTCHFFVSLSLSFIQPSSQWVEGWHVRTDSPWQWATRTNLLIYANMIDISFQRTPLPCHW